jgi:maleate isomerase
MRDVPRVPPEEIRGLARRLSETPCEAIVFLATDLRTFDVIKLIEDELGVSVLTSNQTILWSALKNVDSPSLARGAGKLFLK